MKRLYLESDKKYFTVGFLGAFFLFIIVNFLAGLIFNWTFPVILDWEFLIIGVIVSLAMGFYLYYMNKSNSD